MDGYEVIDPKNYDRLEEMVAALVERRKGKIQLKKKLLEFLRTDVNYFGVMLVYLWLDEAVSGSIHSGQLPQCASACKSLNTSKCNKNFRCSSPHGAWFRTLFFSDCAINIDPDSEALAEIMMINSAVTAKCLVLILRLL